MKQKISTKVIIEAIIIKKDGTIVPLGIISESSNSNCEKEGDK